MTGEAAEDGHLAALPGSGWTVWRQCLLRSAGFPVDGLDLFADPELAAAADARPEASRAGGSPGEAGPDGAGALRAAYEAAGRRVGRAVYEVASDQTFQAALTWQNPGALSAVAGVLRDGPDAVRNARQRRREDLLAKYWQRYCAKNDTAGFFGPMLWTAVDPQDPVAVRVSPGARVAGDLTVYFEWWALDALARRLAQDPGVRRWLPVALEPHLALDGSQLRTPGRPPQQLPAPVAALVSRCDGRRAADLAVELSTGDGAPFRRPEEVYAQLELLAEREIVRWGFDLPMTLAAEDTLAAQLAGIDDETARPAATAAFDRLRAARDGTAAARTPQELAAAMAELEATFAELTGQQAHHRGGETYAGRTLCHAEAVRDVEVSFGAPVLAALVGLEPLLLSARWLTARLAAAYSAALRGLYEDLAAATGRPEVPFDELWFLAQSALFGRTRPAEPVVAEFLDRWAGVLDLAGSAAGTRRLDIPVDELRKAVAEAFPAPAPGWAAARISGPDVHVCAPDAAAAARGEFTIVLGELHIGWATFDTEFFRLGHPDPAELRAAMTADLPGSRVAALLPSDWPRVSARNAEWLHGPADVQLGFAPAPGADRDRLLPVTTLTVVPDGDRLLVRAADGRGWPLLEAFASMLGLHAFDTWKLAGGRGHTPRVTVDGLVLIRETWRCTVGETGLAGVTGELDRYLAARRWRRELGLPERVFVRVATELKPCYVDFTSLVYVRLLCTLLRGAAERGGEDVAVDVTEMLPTADQAWLADSAGRRYTSELRLQVRDPEPARAEPLSRQ